MEIFEIVHDITEISEKYKKTKDNEAIAGPDSFLPTPTMAVNVARDRARRVLGDVLRRQAPG